MQINYSYQQKSQQKALNLGLSFEKEIKKIYSLALKMSNKPDNICVNIVFVSANKIHKMNQQFRGVDKVTDVLSFPMLESFDDFESEIDYSTGLVDIGDIYINIARAKQQAVLYNHSLKREFCFLALHGFLHLLGYDHMVLKEEKEMFALQEKIMTKAKIGRE